MTIRSMGLVLAAGLLAVQGAQAARVSKFAPQGSVGLVETVSVQFDAPVVAFGDDQQPAPLQLTCEGDVPKGQGRWVDDRNWSYSFYAPLGPGVRCSAQLSESLRDLSGAALQGRKAYTFQTGGPQVRDVQPGTYSPVVDEDQVFALRFNGAVDVDSVGARTHCAVEGLGESVPVRVVDGEDRAAILKALYWRADTADGAIQLVQCQRRLPAEARVRLVVGPGIKAADAQAAVPSAQAQVFDYQVRGPFRAEFSCMRENANADCTPVSAMRLTFSAPISREDARKIRLKTPQQDLVPAQDDDDFQGDVTQVRFEGPFQEKSAFSLVLPDGLTDDAGRSLGNAGQFPLALRTAEFPPLVKFAASPFGVIERFAEAPQGGSDVDYPPLVPLTVRNVEMGLAASTLNVDAGELNQMQARGDAEVLSWYARLRRLEQGGWTSGQMDDILNGRKPRSDDGAMMDVRGVSLLAGRDGVQRRVLPATSPRETRPFEVLGVPMDAPGFHVLEVASPKLGGALLADQRTMYVRTGVLVTNLAVHIKKGREDLLAWVTTLDEGKVVEGAQVAVLDCNGKELATGRTGVHGAWHLQQPVDAPDYCPDTGLSGVYVSARIDATHALARGRADFSFAFSDWDRGIESWRFNIPVDTGEQRTMAAHTVLDRMLLRAGETVSMKHFIRDLTLQGMALPDRARLPDQLLILHAGSGQQYELPLQWQETPSGGLTALSEFDLPRSARLGTYSIVLRGPEGQWRDTGEFRVEEFKLPVLKGSLQVTGEDAQPVLVAPRNARLDVQLSYVAGGAAAELPVQVSAVARDAEPQFAGYDAFVFRPPDADSDDAGLPASPDGQRLFLDKAALRTDAAGTGHLSLDALPAVAQPQQWLFEASFQDPNGQIQTLSQSARVWPAAVQAGIRVERWVQAGQSAPIQVVALSPSGQPQEGVSVTVVASSRTLYSTRKRLVGGFYQYDSYSQTRTLGKVCEGRTDSKGLLACAMEMNTPGEIQFIARVNDAQGRTSTAASSVWVTGTDDLWFGGENADRIDLLADRKEFAPGGTAEFQVRMPFRHAVALLAIEREGILGMQVVELDGKDPTVRLTVRPEWGPNAYVSVLAVRGRLRQTPWHSFFSWGWQRPAQWYKAFRSNDQGYSAPTPFIDLAKPAFRHGLMEIRINDMRDQLLVQVTPDKPDYRVRDVAKVGVQVMLPDGRPAEHATVAFAAVDQALLELAPNGSWDLLQAMRQRRSHGVQTATTQLEVVGRRHYGRKALPAGGGGGTAGLTRELLDTLLLWQPAVQLDAQGRATIDVPLNDAITQFALVAIADYGDSRFGTGKASIAVTQDLQVLAGLPALVREGDAYQATVTLRNATKRAMTVEVEASYELRGQGHPGSLPLQRIEVPAGAARLASWQVQVPEGGAPDGDGALLWRLQAREVAAGATQAGAADDLHAVQDTLLFTQRVVAAVPLRTQQATLQPLDAGAPPSQWRVAAPAAARVDDGGHVRGGLRVALRPKLAADGLDGVRDWFAAYPYTCTEQLASRAVGMHDAKQWDALMHEVSGAQDADGLVAYFPGMRQGNEVLTAYLLSISHEARTLGLPFAIPKALEQSMLDGLQAFAQGRIARSRWSPSADRDLRKLVVLDALSRYGVDVSRMLDSIAVRPEHWPSSAVIDWWQILQRTPHAASRAAQMRKAESVLRARLIVRGTEMVLSDVAGEAPWWLMQSQQTTLARLLLAVSGQVAWAEDAPRLAQGLLNQQVHGAWRTTTENALGSLALEKFSRQYERRPVTGTTRFAVGQPEQPEQVEWNARQPAKTPRVAMLPWPAPGQQDSLWMQHAGTGRVWAEVRALAAVPRTEPISAGFQVRREIVPVSQAESDRWQVGDVYRVRLHVRSQTATTWAVVNDPVPAGATILGSGLGRDSAIAAQASQPADWQAVSPSFVERAFEGLRAYYEYLPAGETVLEYTVRLNTAGEFHLPGTRVEALYQPDVYGMLPDTERFPVTEGFGGQ